MPTTAPEAATICVVSRAAPDFAWSVLSLMIEVVPSKSLLLIRLTKSLTWASVTMPVPTSFFFAGRTFYARWYIADPSAQNGFSVTPAAKYTVFGRFITTTNITAIDP